MSAAGAVATVLYEGVDGGFEYFCGCCGYVYASLFVVLFGVPGPLLESCEVNHGSSISRFCGLCGVIGGGIGVGVRCWFLVVGWCMVVCFLGVGVVFGGWCV